MRVTHIKVKILFNSR